MEHIKEFKQYLNDNFWKWFGNSKVVDEHGNPKVCYHGTNRDFDVFRTDAGHAHDQGYYGKGIYFTHDSTHGKSEAKTYGKNIMECYLKIENPFYFNKLSEYEGTEISLMFYEPYAFLYNVAKTFPEIANTIFIDKIKWNGEEIDATITKLPISELVKLIDQYKNDIEIIDYEDNHGRNVKSGYVKSKSKTVTYDYTEKGGNKGEYLDYDNLGTYLTHIPIEEIKFGLIIDAIKKYENIDYDYLVEGTMTRNPQITEAIKKHGHDGIFVSDEMIVFDPMQIKSATNNNGNFSNKTANINEKNQINIQNKYLNDNFWKWFGKSKIVDEKGNPKVMYHGTKTNFDDFAVSERGAIWVSEQPKTAHHFITDKEDDERPYSVNSSIIPVYVKSEKVFDFRKEKDIDTFIKKLGKYNFEKQDDGYKELEDFIDDASVYIPLLKKGRWVVFEDMIGLDVFRNLGYDGVYMQELTELTLAVFKPTQLKSAIGNNGSFGQDKESLLEHGSTSDIYNMVLKSEIGERMSDTNIYIYCQKLHRNEEDFWDGDLGERIEKYRNYILKEIDIDIIDYDEFQLYEEDVEKYVEMYNENNNYPPIVLEPIYMGRYTIIDGTHRANALNELGIKKIKAWVGTNK